MNKLNIIEKKLNIDKIKITKELLGSGSVFNDSIRMLNIVYNYGTAFCKQLYNYKV